MERMSVKKLIRRINKRRKREAEWKSWKKKTRNLAVMMKQQISDPDSERFSPPRFLQSHVVWNMTSSKTDPVHFYQNVLKCPKLIAAPMVDQSELAFRILLRKYKAQLCYTPMFHAVNFARDAKYRKDNFSTNPDDRPLIVQVGSM